MELPRGNKCVAIFCRLKSVLRGRALERERERRRGRRERGVQRENQRTNRNP
jgi:hypothetical protein